RLAQAGGKWRTGPGLAPGLTQGGGGTRPAPPCAALAVVFGRRGRAVLLDRVDGVLGRGLGRIAFGREDGLGIVFEADAVLASLVLVDLELVGHRNSPVGGMVKLSQTRPGSNPETSGARHRLVIGTRG